MKRNEDRENREALARRVEAVVRQVIAELPPDLRVLAERIPVRCE